MAKIFFTSASLYATWFRNCGKQETPRARRKSAGAKSRSSISLAKIRNQFRRYYTYFPQRPVLTPLLRVHIMVPYQPSTIALVQTLLFWARQCANVAVRRATCCANNTHSIFCLLCVCGALFMFLPRYIYSPGARASQQITTHESTGSLHKRGSSLFLSTVSLQIFLPRCLKAQQAAPASRTPSEILGLIRISSL